MKQTLAMLLLAVTLSVFAHGDEDHGAAPPMINQSVAPRAVASTDEFELVAILDGKKLMIYVDRFASNEPVINAKVEIEGAGLKGIVSETAPGLYTINAPSIAPGRHALTISIESGDVLDLLSATLDTSIPAGNIAPVSSWNKKLMAIFVGLLILAGVALLLARRRKQVKGI
ncbi:MAG: hypothetical protein Q7K57_03810 [Burkholderiaceae bacterium]|jgi:hypothetical protein|nr:hypothetical protein [Burkholderiaceae bacterium]